MSSVQGNAKEGIAPRQERIVRVFLVGCPRSGTTLLQSLLAAHPRVLSFPESHFFTLGFGGNFSDRLRKRLLGGWHLEQVFRDWLRRIGDMGFAPTAPVRRTWRRKRMVAQFVAQLDDWTRRADKDVWIEKTPMHIDHIHQIVRYIPDARFLHLVRDGRAVVASLYEVTRRYPERWGGPRAIDACIAQWNLCLKITQRYRGQPNHYLVCYEHLVRDPETVLRGICAFLGIEWRHSMLEDMGHAAEKIVLSEEAWKKTNMQGRIVMRDTGRFRKVFSEAEQRMITERLHLRLYHELCEA